MTGSKRSHGRESAPVGTGARPRGPWGHNVTVFISVYSSILGDIPCLLPSITVFTTCYQRCTAVIIDFVSAIGWGFHGREKAPVGAGARPRGPWGHTPASGFRVERLISRVAVAERDGNDLKGLDDFRLKQAEAKARIWP